MTRDQIASEVRRLVHDQQHTTLGGIRTPIDQIAEDKTLVDDLGFDSLDSIEFIMAVEGLFDLEVPDQGAENILTVGQAIDWLAQKLDAQADPDEETCIACAVAFKDGDMVLNDASGGALHVGCCGPERESYTNADGDPLGPDDPIPTGYAWTKWPSKAEAA